MTNSREHQSRRSASGLRNSLVRVGTAGSMAALVLTLAVTATAAHSSTAVPSAAAPSTVVPVAGAVLGPGLDELVVETRNFESESMSAETNGTTFASSRVSTRLDSYYDRSFFDLNLGRRFGALQAAVGVSDFSDADFVVEYTITLDAQQPLTGTLGVGQLLPLDLSVIDVLRARFEFEVVEGEGTVVLGNLTLVPAA